MKKLYLAIIILLGASLVLSGHGLCQDKPKTEKEKVDEFVNKIKETGQKYTTTVDNFNGSVVVMVGDKLEMVTLAPGESLKVPKGTPTEKGVVSWKSVTEYENKMMLQRNPLDQRVRWFVENIQTDRVNNVLNKLEQKLRGEWENKNPGKTGPKKLSFYMPGNNDTEKYAALGDIIDQTISYLGMDKIAPFTNIEWRAKFVTGNERLYKADLRELAQREDLIQYFTTIESLILDSSQATFVSATVT